MALNTDKNLKLYYSIKEVAEMMGISENTSRSQYSRARVKLLEIMKHKDLI